MRTFFVFLFCFLFLFSFVVAEISSSTESSFFIDPDSPDDYDGENVYDKKDYKKSPFNFLSLLKIIAIAVVLYFVVRYLMNKGKEANGRKAQVSTSKGTSGNKKTGKNKKRK